MNPPLNPRISTERGASPDDAKSRLELMKVNYEELDQLRALLSDMRADIDENALKALEYEKRSIAVQISAQVAHDIRSPLTALSILVGNSSELNETKRNLLKNAVTRIQDIANTLNGDQSPASLNSTSASDSHILALHIDSLISEKRSEFSGRKSISIQFDLQWPCLEIFASVQLGEFKRVLSNIINNSVEAVPSDRSGKVEIRLMKQADLVIIEIVDNGSGIPNSIASKVFEHGFTHGKHSGSGLGLYHARQTLEKWGGSILIRESTSAGTKLELRLKSANRPSWLAPNLNLIGKKSVVVADDMHSVHDVWCSRISSLKIERFLNLRDLESHLPNVKIKDTVSSFFLVGLSTRAFSVRFA
jgi:signal transduction histidine kinase